MDVFPRGWDKTYSLQFVDKEGFEGKWRERRRESGTGRQNRVMTFFDNGCDYAPNARERSKAWSVSLMMFNDMIIFIGLFKYMYIYVIYAILVCAPKTSNHHNSQLFSFLAPKPDPIISHAGLLWLWGFTMSKIER